jgi:hypothetical protein
MHSMYSFVFVWVRRANEATDRDGLSGGLLVLWRWEAHQIHSDPYENIPCE